MAGIVAVLLFAFFALVGYAVSGWAQDREEAKEALGRRLTTRSEEHTSELQSHSDLVCRLLLEKKKHRCARSRRRGWSPPRAIRCWRCRGARATGARHSWTRGCTMAPCGTTGLRRSRRSQGAGR